MPGTEAEVFLGEKMVSGYTPAQALFPTYSVTAPLNTHHCMELYQSRFREIGMRSSLLLYKYIQDLLVDLTNVKVFAL